MSDSKTTVQLTAGAQIEFDYLNWRGETGHRRVEVSHAWYGATKWHPEPGWLLTAIDMEKREQREFAMRDMKEVRYAD